MSTSESGVDEPGAAQDAERARQAAYMKKVADNTSRNARTAAPS